DPCSNPDNAAPDRWRWYPALQWLVSGLNPISTAPDMKTIRDYRVKVNRDRHASPPEEGKCRNSWENGRAPARRRRFRAERHRYSNVGRAREAARRNDFARAAR